MFIVMFLYHNALQQQKQQQQQRSRNVCGKTTRERCTGEEIEDCNETAFVVDDE
jgi:hypothetical protein